LFFREARDIGDIPIGKRNLVVQLESSFDIDLQLYDASDTSSFLEGKAIIAFSTCDEADPACNKALLGTDPGEKCALYKSVNICYSGFKGVKDPVTGADRPGYEFVRVEGTTPSTFKLKGFAYKAGKAKIRYTYYEL